MPSFDCRGSLARSATAGSFYHHVRQLPKPAVRTPGQNRGNSPRASLPPAHHPVRRDRWQLLRLAYLEHHHRTFQSLEQAPVHTLGVRVPFDPYLFRMPQRGAARQ